MNLKRVQAHLKSQMLLYVAAAIGLGWGLGYVNGPFIKQNQPTLKTLITVIVFMMIYPMMINVRLEALGKAARNLKGLGLTLFYNFLWAPLFGFALSKFFLHDPEVGFGFLLVMVVPCSSMSLGYTGLVAGDLELATVAIAASFVTAVAAIPAAMLPIFQIIFLVSYVKFEPWLRRYFGAPPATAYRQGQVVETMRSS